MRLLAFICAVFMISCTSESDCKIAYEVPFVIKKGETYCLPNNTNIFIQDITESYCPCNADCLWEGEAEVTITASGEIGTVTTTIHEKRNQDDVTWLSITSIELTETCDPDIASISIIVGLE